ncbi:MAG: universal stress protein [Thermodesulfobacteriota bacterium]
MFKHILIPLDGSKMAESVMPIALFLSEHCKSEITLIHIIERHAPTKIHSDRHIRFPEEALTYLENVKTYFPDRLNVSYHVHTTEVGHVAQSLADHANELDCDLIVMCTHGRIRLQQLLFGTIAQQTINIGNIPVLVIHPDAFLDSKPFSCSKMLVPLDISEEHEKGIKTARGLATVLGCSLYVIVVIQTLATLSGPMATESRLAPVATAEMLELEEEKALNYLKGLTSEISSDGIPVSGEVARGEPSDIIAKTALEIRADLIVMGTHGKAGADAFWSGSVTPRVFNRTNIPLLLVPI